MAQRVIGLYTDAMTGWVLRTLPSTVLDRDEILIVAQHKLCGRRFGATVTEKEMERSADPAAWMSAGLCLLAGRHEHECFEELPLWNER